MKLIRKFAPLYVAMILALAGFGFKLFEAVLYAVIDGDWIPLAIWCAFAVLFAFVMRGLLKVLKAYFKLREATEMNALMNLRFKV